MADEATAAPEQAPAEDGGGKKKGMMMTIGLIAGVAILEAVLFFVFIKVFYSSPDPAHGESGEHVIDDGAAPMMSTAEVPLATRFKVPNTSKGVTYIYDFDISMVVPAEQMADAKSLVEARQGQLQDRIARIVRAANARILDEVDFKTLRGQFEEAVRDVLDNDEIVVQVLIPRCVPLRAE